MVATAKIAVECPLCQGRHSRSLFKFKGTDIVECEHCSLIYVPTAAPEFAAVYREDYFASNRYDQGYFNYASEFENHMATFKARLEDCERILLRKGRVLDVGCALGHFGEAAKRQGWDVYLTDVSDYAVIESRKQFAINGFISGPTKIPVKKECFDLVTLYDVIEHLSHPMDLLRDIKQALGSDGILHITTPNVTGFSAALMGKKWYHLKPDENFLYFSPKTIQAMLEKCGFEVLKIKPVSVYFRVNDVLNRLQKYSRLGVRFLRAVVQMLGLGGIRLRLITGEMQVWAKVANGKSVRETRPVKDILDIVCCPKCRSEIQLFEDTEAICTQCELQFEVTAGVINFSKYAKRTRRQIAGSS
jgi:2-polyprenyl-3-methyl-5-hydroxy-6-metoxy-1,4-benzoquinol methylase